MISLGYLWFLALPSARVWPDGTQKAALITGWPWGSVPLCGLDPTHLVFPGGMALCSDSVLTAWRIRLLYRTAGSLDLPPRMTGVTTDAPFAEPDVLELAGTFEPIAAPPTTRPIPNMALPMPVPPPPRLVGDWDGCCPGRIGLAGKETSSHVTRKFSTKALGLALSLPRVIDFKFLLQLH